MYIIIIFIVIFILINLSLQTNRVEKFINWKKIGRSIKNTANKAGGAIKNTANKAGGAIKNTANKVGGELEKVAPIPKKSYVPKTYPKASYGIGVGQIPLMIIMRPLKPGVKVSRVNL